ncbi:MAG TPA: tetratricopeptide repeat protein [Kofleriaceae bacterium]
MRRDLKLRISRSARSSAIEHPIVAPTNDNDAGKSGLARAHHPTWMWHPPVWAGILPTVRWLCLAALSLFAGQAEARPPRTAPRDDSGASTLWREVVEPHGVQVATLLARARTAMSKLGDSEGSAPERRLHHASDAYGMLRYARKLSPDNPDVLTLLGRAADELGKTREAIDALEACIRVEGPDRAGPEVTSRLGTIYLRLGKLDEAIRWLRYAQGPISVGNNAAIAVHLATALAARGEMSDAIDVLANALPASASSYFTDPVTMVSFALAVHYDRDEQRGAAFEILDRMQAALQQELGQFVQRTLADLRFAPPEDEYYYHALLYEALGAFAEARAEWLLYAAVPDAPWRLRALDHVRALDALRASPASRPINLHPPLPVP